jgi:hypothetical protein
MVAKATQTVDDDAPALAGAIVEHAGAVCDAEDHLWRVLGRVSLLADGLADARQQAKVANGTEPMARVCPYQSIYDLARAKSQIGYAAGSRAFWFTGKVGNPRRIYPMLVSRLWG